MENNIMAGIIFLATLITPAPQPKSYDKPIEPPKYSIQAGDSLASIALKEYGSTDYWTTLWNDNSWIQNSNIIEPGKKLSIRSHIPAKPEELKPELANKISQNFLVYVPNTQSDAKTAPAIYTSSPSSLTDDQINFLGSCESGMTAERNSGNGFYGAFQFAYGTWSRMGTGYERADLAPLDVQKDAVQRLLQGSSIYSQFPGCSSKMRASGLL